MPERPAVPAPPISRIFELPSGMRIAADVSGDPEALPVLFLHGGGQTRHAWAGAAETVVNAGYHAITMDLRGHGDSAWAPDGRYAIEGFAEDLAAIVEQLGRAPVAVGASLGGITALQVSAWSPSALAALVLVDVTPRLEIPGVMRVVSFMIARPDGFASLDEAADAVASYLPHRPRPKDQSGLHKNLRLGADGRYRWHWDPTLMKLWNPERFEPGLAERIMEERLRQARALTIPTLLVRGRMSDVVSEEGAREFLAAAPHAEYVDLAAAGHMVAGDRNDAFTGSVVSFLGRRFETGRSR